MDNLEKELENLFFKPLRLKTELVDGGEFDEIIIIIYGHTTQTSTVISPTTGKQQTTNIVTFNMLNVTETIINGYPIIETRQVADASKILESLEIIENDNDIHEEVYEVIQVLSTAMQELMGQLANLSNAMASLKCIMSDDKDIKNQLLVNGDEAGLAYIAFNAIGKSTSTLSPKEVEKIGSVIMEIIASHVGSEIESETFANKLKAEVEYKIIEAMPAKMKAGDIQINVNAIIDEIKRFRELPDMEEEGD